jgi:endonuclease/exonuclease/phosphatase family metal-dependent hydrolase
MVDARRLAVHHGLSSTFPSRFPMLRIDHVFIGGQMRTLSVGAPYNPLTRVASDHLPLVVDFQP